MAQQLVELTLIGPVGPFDLSVKSGGSGFDIGVPHSKIFDMPVELSLEFVPVDSADRMNPEGELLHNIIDEVDGAALVVAVIKLQGPDSGCVVDGGVLKPLDRLSRGTYEFQEHTFDLDVVSRHLLLVPLGWNGSDGAILREAVHPVSPKNLVDPPSGILDGMISHQVQNNPLRPEVVFPSEMQDLLFDRDWNPAGKITSWPSFPIDQHRFPSTFEGLFPFVERVVGDALISAGLRDVSRIRSM